MIYRGCHVEFPEAMNPKNLAPGTICIFEETKQEESLCIVNGKISFEKLMERFLNSLTLENRIRLLSFAKTHLVDQKFIEYIRWIIVNICEKDSLAKNHLQSFLKRPEVDAIVNDSMFDDYDFLKSQWAIRYFSGDERFDLGKNNNHLYRYRKGNLKTILRSNEKIVEACKSSIQCNKSKDPFEKRKYVVLPEDDPFYIALIRRS
ncbi:Hypothetical protein POVR1_LOCUS29 [uncultured virus]|nr:Hypothetical protein POVR1_LOCUS29 [uncultured virus]